MAESAAVVGRVVETVAAGMVVAKKVEVARAEVALEGETVEGVMAEVGVAVVMGAAERVEAATGEGATEVVATVVDEKVEGWAAEEAEEGADGSSLYSCTLELCSAHN